VITPQSFQCEVGGRTLIIQTGKLATQATSAVTVTYGETVVLVTLCVAPAPREGTDFLPLTIDYEERFMPPVKSPVVSSAVKAARVRKPHWPAA
jgi:polyribonucleotide nucleotidyltransferase